VTFAILIKILFNKISDKNINIKVTQDISAQKCLEEVEKKTGEMKPKGKSK